MVGHSLQDGLLAVWRNPQNRAVIRKLIITTVIMCSFPFFVFYCVEWLMNAAGKNESSRLMWSGFAAVGAVQVVIVGYVVMALREDDGPSAESSKNK
mmetsp:Transcript_40629/g.87885  ORF Transcript_40629/g.87885 Transcript_40629/m.87885 type:complete len:97 (+) Transcript_40629:3-293(+)